MRGIVKRHHGRWGVVSGKAKYLDLKVIEVLKGAIQDPLLLIVGDNGAQCRRYVSEFKVGSEWVLVLTSAAESSSRHPAYEISRCSETALGVANGQVGGALTRSGNGRLETLDLPELRDQLKAP